MGRENEFIAKVHVRIHSSVSNVWDALTNPELIKQYLYGTETVTDWKVGSRITFKGMWEGKEYVDGGTILKIELEKILQYTYWSSMSGTEDTPENYSTITFELLKENNGTLLTLANDNCKTEKMRDHLVENWRNTLNGLKALVENKL